MSEVKLKNPWGFNWDEVNERDIVKACLIADIPVYIHGLPGIGKSSLASSLDPNIVRVNMSTATYYKILGKEIANTTNGSIINIKPNWLEKAENNVSKDPGKINVLFFDELTNAEIDDQKKTLDIILDRTVNDLWNIPNQVRIIAAGNEVSDSSAAYDLLETLHSRFAHVFLEPDAKEWLNWTSSSYQVNKLDVVDLDNNYKIHPAIYAFIYFNQNKIYTNKDSRGMYINPRGWEMASKLLFQTKNPEYLRCLMDRKTLNEFIRFTKANIVSIDSLDIDIDNRNINYIYEAIGLAYQATEDNFDKIYDYIRNRYDNKEALIQYKLIYNMKK